MHIPQLIRDRAKEIDFLDAYRHAIEYLQQCVEVDQVKGVADDLDRAALYYKQKNDPIAIRYIRKIQLFSAARLGELLKRLPFDAAEPQHRWEYDSTDVKLETLNKVLDIPTRDRRNAMLIASMPAEIRQSYSERPMPPTVGTLAKISEEVTRPPESDTERQQRVRAEDRAVMQDAIYELGRLSEKYGPKEAMHLCQQEITQTIIDLPTIVRVGGWLREMMNYAGMLRSTKARRVGR